ncbi:MAG TPA: hypothetical protein VGN12_18995 [Pirellulales bacterium]|jgi:hypothetical protein
MSDSEIDDLDGWVHDLDYLRCIQQRMTLQDPEPGDVCRYREGDVILEVRLLAKRKTLKVNGPWTDYDIEIIRPVVFCKRYPLDDRFTVGGLDAGSYGTWYLDKLLPEAPQT